MKVPIIGACFLLTTAIHFSVNAQTTDPVKKARESNHDKAKSGAIDKDVSEFLMKAADARMMDKIEGSMAAKSGTTAAIRNYGNQMIKDQGMLLLKIKQLASARQISLPSQISNNKEDGRKSLADKTGKDFDEKFISMMRIDHERDIKMFTSAIELKDPAVSKFARTYLPLLEKHLEGVNALEPK